MVGESACYVNGNAYLDNYQPCLIMKAQQRL